MGDPSETAVKTLFAHSRNLCCFGEPPAEGSERWTAGCEERLTDPRWSQVNGEIAHIKGERPRSARYDPDQLETDRQGFENLMLLCPKHHKLIDRLQPERFPVDILVEMKGRHLSHGGVREWCTDLEAVEFARQAIVEAIRAVIGEEAGPPMPRNVIVLGTPPVNVQFSATPGEVRTAEQTARARIVTASGPRLIVRREVTAVDVVNVGDDDAYGLTLQPLNPSTADGLVLATIPPGLLPPGESWRAGAFAGHFTDAETARINVTWRNRSGRLFGREFAL